jgi:hypothetical protein
MWRSTNFNLMLGFFGFSWSVEVIVWNVDAFCIELVYIVWIRVCSMNIPSLSTQKIQCSIFASIMSPSLTNTNYLIVNTFVLMNPSS